MSSRKMTQTERISVTDQVGKRHVVLRYVDLVETDPADAAEYRLTTGTSVNKTGADTFETADGRLRLKVL